MKQGDVVKLIPGISTMDRESRSASYQERLNETVRSLTEEVTILNLLNSTGNAKVRDQKGITFFCNPNDLQII